jgi:hypothetical protein
MIVIVGVGALGSPLGLYLRNEEAGLKFVDHDRIEAKNVMAQAHTKMGISKNKTIALQQMLRGFFGVETIAVPHKLTKDNAEQLLAGADLVIDCTDNFDARIDIMEAVRKLDVPCLHAAVSADGDFGQIIWTEFFKPDEDEGDGATCEDGRHLPFYSRLSGHLGWEAQHFLKTGKKRSWQLSDQLHQVT